MLETYVLQELQVEAEGDTLRHTRAQGTHMLCVSPSFKSISDFCA